MADQNGYIANKSSFRKATESMIKSIAGKWKSHHANMQKEFNEGYSMGIREVGWNPFKKKK